MEYDDIAMRKVMIYNSLGNRLEEFKPIKENEVSFYVCGPTVYNSPHIGNMRPVIVFDAWRRLFMSLGYDVKFVSNYTDVDDKIINRAKELGIPESQLTEEVIGEFRSLVDQVGSLQPDVTPKPTVYMEQMIRYIDELVEKGSAYESGGDVYFKVEEIPTYGELSGNTIESLESGARIEVNSQKQSPLDFALWKKTDEGIKWNTPWSYGRPGWHTECCVMIASIFADQGGLIDIHGGGFDLKFPHHENEIAQSRAHNQNRLANYWIHNGFINIDNEKMSKSLGNVLLAKDVVAQFGGMPFRLMVLNAHYRAPLSFTAETIAEAGKNYQKISMAFKALAVKLQLEGIDVKPEKSEDVDAFYDELCNDLNTPNALSILYAEIKNANALLRARPIDLDAVKKCYNRLADYLWTLGLTVEFPIIDEEGRKLFAEYNEAKANRDFEKSDLLRAKLIGKGIL